MAQITRTEPLMISLLGLPAREPCLAANTRGGEGGGIAGVRE